MSIDTFLLIALVSVCCGACIAIAYSVKDRLGKSLMLSLTVLPFITATVLIMVNGSIGTGIAIAGALSLVRFRSAQGKAKEIASVFASMAAGLVCACGYIFVAVIFTLLFCAVMIAVKLVPFGNTAEMSLRITIPESLSFTGVFDDILKKYTSSYVLDSVKTSDLGSLYKMHYRVVLKKDTDIKMFIDELRTRNGNLEILISEAEERTEEL